MSWVWKSGPDDPQQRYVLLKLADNANQDGRCWPSLAEIAMTTRLSESTVRRCVNGLEKGGWLEVNRGLGRSKNSQYTLIEKVSGSNHLKEKVSQRKVSHRLIKGVTQTEKGVSLKKPPTPPLVEEPSRTTNEPSQGELTLLSPLAPPEPKLRPEEFANTWNRLRGNLPKVDKFTEDRRRKVVTRMSSGLTLDHFAKAVENCRAKPFLYGDNDRGWTATFDWLIANGTNLEKAIEQPYGLNKNGGSNGNGKTAGNREAALEVIAEYANNNGSSGSQLVPVRESRQGLPEAFHGTTIEGKP